MSRHQDVRNLDYEEALDEYDEDGCEEEDDELSPEDRESMLRGTLAVQAALGSEVDKVTVAQIEEALWHYYYDIDKSVTYLVTRFVSPPGKAPKAPKKAAQGSLSAAKGGFLNFHTCRRPLDHKSFGKHVLGAEGRRDCLMMAPLNQLSRSPIPPFTRNQGGRCYLQAFPARSESRQSFSAFFWDMPWGRMPEDRLAIFVEPFYPPGGLLGGSGANGPPKMSKLQQLAAARKKKAEEKKVGECAEGARKQMVGMSIQDSPVRKENIAPQCGFGKRLKTLRSSAEGHQLLRPTEPGARKTPQEPLIEATRTAAQNLDALQSPGAEMNDIPAPIAKPSKLAATLFDTNSELSHPLAKTFALPYLSENPSILDAFSDPSPDDVALAAQAQAGKKPNALPAKKKDSANIDGVTVGASALKIDDTPLPRSKNLDVLSEFDKTKGKKMASFVVVGHVDAGKSTMMGRLLLDLNVVDQRTVERLRQEASRIGKASFALAWVLDQRTEERSRGVTIDVATNRFETDSTVFTILDAPGHRDFIPNMIAGASQADFAILVVDASIGSFESGLKGQTKEHTLLLRSMGVSRIIVAVNKLDTVSWSQERFEEIKNQLSGFFFETRLGFQEKNIAFVPVSGLHGDNLVRKSDASAAAWHTGPTLVEELEKSEPNARALAKPLRMTISEVYSTPRSPVTVCGRLDAGSLQMGDALLVQPSGERAYVKSLMVNDKMADWAVAGQNVVLHLSDLDAMHVRLGDIVCDPVRPIPCLDLFTMKAFAFDVLLPMQVDVHRGRLHSAGTITEITALLDKTTGTIIKKRPKIVKPDSVARIVVKLTSKVPLEAGVRVVLRSGGHSVAAGLLE